MPEAFVQRIQPPLTFIPPNYTGWLRQGIDLVLPWWMRHQLAIADCQTENVEVLVELFRQFQARETRFMIAFRHPSTVDPFCMAHLLWRSVPATARSLGVSLQSPTHVHFLYDRGIPLWAGSSASWVLSRMGGISIQRGKADRRSLRTAVDILTDGRFPLAVAPEGATNNHSEIVSPLEPGIAQMAFWTVEALRQADRDERVAVLPVGIQYAYGSPPWEAIDQLLEELETSLGLAPLAAGGKTTHSGSPARRDRRYLRLYRLGDRLLDLMEGFYRDFYGQTLPPVPDATPPSERLGLRLKNLLDVALQVAESYFGVLPKGSVGDRCRRLEQAGWDRIYREDAEQLSPVERGLADWVAAEASFRMGHMRLVERFAAVTGRYVLEQPTAERFAETLLIVWRMVAWLQGRDPSNPPNLGLRRASLRVGQPIWVSDRATTYRNGRRQAVTDLTQDLQDALTDLIVPTIPV